MLTMMADRPVSLSTEHRRPRPGLKFKIKSCSGIWLIGERLGFPKVAWPFNHPCLTIVVYRSFLFALFAQRLFLRAAQFWFFAKVCARGPRYVAMTGAKV